jgi:hypothetical protein
MDWLKPFVLFVSPFVLFVLPFVSFVSCSAPPARAEQVRAAEQPTWHALGSWSGRGSRQTESFDVTTGALRLTWKATKDAGAPATGVFRVSLYSAISGRALQVFVERTDSGEGTAYVADDPRVSYLVIDAEHMTWKASLEEAGERR